MVSESSPVSEFVTALLDFSSSRSTFLLEPDARRLEKLWEEFSRKLACRLREAGVAPSLGADDALPSLLALDVVQPMLTHLGAARRRQTRRCDRGRAGCGWW